MTHANTTPPAPSDGGTATSTARRLHAVVTIGQDQKEPYGPIIQAEHGSAPPGPTSVATGVTGIGTAVAAGGIGDVTGPRTPPVDYSNTAVVDGEATSTGRAAAPSGFSREWAELDRQGAAQVARARTWLPTVDPAVFGCYLGHLAQRIDPYTEGDPTGVLASLVCAAGVHFGPGPHLELGFGERHPLLVWPILIGSTGIGRKGTATNAAFTLFGAADPYFVANNKHTGLSSGEGLAAAFAVDPGDTDGNAAGGKPRLLPEGDCRLLAEEQEWAAVMARMKREGNTLGALLRQAWEGGNLSTLNVNARMASRSHLGIIAHITPKEFRGKLSAGDLAGGTYNRFLPVAVAQSKESPPPPDPELVGHLAASLAARLDHAGRLDTLTFTDDAQLHRRRLQIEFNGHLGGDGPVEEFISRAAANCVRIAAIYAALDRTPLITPEHLEAAAALVRYSIASANAVLGTDRDERDLAAFIAAAGPDGCTKTLITKRFCKDDKTTARFRAALEHLVDAGDVTVVERPRADGRPGRGSQVYVTTRT
ncbi:hypothetical protein GCM10022243_63620 [Saccharothrix violaceirubra]|uniref:DUF3987 domain-containing protein n=1 Tax=Saccharothrix violaceirubra TaxID=413306 RepID=UPI0031EF0E29